MLFIFNPRAGKCKAAKVLPQILAEFAAAGYDVHVHETTGPGDGKQAVIELGAGKDLIVCCGGDGTFNEAVSGVITAGLNIPIGYIPAGSTNDFAQSLGLPAKPLEAAKQILSGVANAYDVGVFQDRQFTYVASFGAFTRASYATSQKLKNRLGHFAYILSGVGELFRIHSEQMRFVLEDGEVLEGKYIFGAISNSTSLGGVMKLDPKQVDMRDGLFEVMLIRPPKHIGELFRCVWALLRKKHNCDMITFRKTARLWVESEKALSWSLDGEEAMGPMQLQIQTSTVACG